ncbi:MAG: adenine deaminase [Bacteroidales bacterium]|nr:adenine deaminase [Bacteroidales bacterium]
MYDPIAKSVIPGRIILKKNRIERIEPDNSITGPIILPGFVDSHIHIESSMLIPTEFSKIAAKHGTIAVVADPHEIANVAGVEGIDFMINNSKSAQIKFFFGAPSCVPVSQFDDCYEIIDSVVINKLMKRNDIYFLGEMMNFPGVINSDTDIMRKISSALDNKKPVDGHAPGLVNESLKKYIYSGITTDHECFTLSEAKEKIRLGMKVQIREGSAAKNFNTLNSLITEYPLQTMLCTDDCHPEDLIIGHINKVVKRSLNLGHDIFDILQVVSVNPVKHYNIEVGLLQVGDFADFIIVDNLKDFNVKSNIVNGLNILENNLEQTSTPIDIFNYTFSSSMELENLDLIAKGNKVKIIEVLEGELVTNIIEEKVFVKNGRITTDVEKDILKIVVVNRYKKNELSIGLIKGFGLKKGAIAESIAHDSHHIIAVGVDDQSIFNAINYIIRNKGGVCYFNGFDIIGLALPVYGLMGFDSGDIIADKYKEINSKVAVDGCKLHAPFMTLSFMALSVIPMLKITPRGLFDVTKFQYTDLFIQ